MLSEEQIIFHSIFFFIVVDFVWELYLSLRQLRVYKNSVKVPSELSGILSHDTYEKARLYGLDKCNFGVVKDVFGMFFTSAIMLTDGFYFFWRVSDKFVGNFGFTADNDIVHSVAFALLMNAFSTVLNLPLSVYNTFVLEEKHGFNKQTVAFFVKDKIKSFVVGQTIMLSLIAVMIYIVQKGGDYFFLYLWVFAMVVTFVLMTIYPNYIAPLFDKYTSLPEGELRTKIEALASSIGFPLYKLYVVEGSKRSTHSNAYFYGLFKNKRIVLFDTLLKDYVPENAPKKEAEASTQKEGEKEDEVKKGCDVDEVLAILGHELGHWKLNHVTKNIVIMQLNLLFMFLAFAMMFKYEAMYRAFGFTLERPVIIGFMVVLQLIFTPYNAVLGFLLTILSRRFEFQADAFAKSLGRARYLHRALIKLNQDNLGFPVYDWLYSSWHHSHPPLLERLKALDYKQE